MSNNHTSRKMKLFLLIPSISTVLHHHAITAFSISSSSSSSSSHRGRRLTISSISSDIEPFQTTTKTTTTEFPHQSSPSLQEFDPELAHYVECEEMRQKRGLELIASENFASRNVREVLGSCLTNKYSEGMVGKRYYGGNQYIDSIESLCQTRALQLYNLSPQEWGVNVQPYSGSPANFAAYTALLQPHDRIMGLDLPSGGHLTHGYITPSGKKVSATSVYFESMPYIVDPTTGIIDYDDMAYRAKAFQPKLLIAGGSAYPREWDYKRFRAVADSIDAILLVDMAHISGLVAAQCVDNPFEYADVVTSTTHKTLRGPRAGMIFAKKEYMDRIDQAVFPMLQGGPHNHQIGALCVALKEAQSEDFRRYVRQVLANAKRLAEVLKGMGHTLATDGTDNHLVLWDVRPLGLTGSKLEKVLEKCSITTNKNSIAGDVSAINPGGVRLGTPALTSRGLMEEDFEKVADFLHRGSLLAQRVQQKAMKERTDEEKGKKVKLKDFLMLLEGNEEFGEAIEELKRDVEDFAMQFDMPGC